MPPRGPRDDLRVLVIGIFLELTTGAQPFDSQFQTSILRAPIAMA
jgi:hypothetical protein